MELKEFIARTLNNLEELEGGTVEFDLGILSGGIDGDEIRVSREGHPGLSRIRFSVKISNKERDNV